MWYTHCEKLDVIVFRKRNSRLNAKWVTDLKMEPSTEKPSNSNSELYRVRFQIGICHHIQIYKRNGSWTLGVKDRKGLRVGSRK